MNSGIFFLKQISVCILLLLVTYAPAEAQGEQGMNTLIEKSIQTALPDKAFFSQCRSLSTGKEGLHISTDKKQASTSCWTNYGEGSARIDISFSRHHKENSSNFTNLSVGSRAIANLLVDFRGRKAAVWEYMNGDLKNLDVEYFGYYYRLSVSLTGTSIMSKAELFKLLDEINERPLSAVTRKL